MRGLMTFQILQEQPTIWVPFRIILYDDWSIFPSRLFMLTFTHYHFRIYWVPFFLLYLLLAICARFCLPTVFLSSVLISSLLQEIVSNAYLTLRRFLLVDWLKGSFLFMQSYQDVRTVKESSIASVFHTVIQANERSQVNRSVVE